MCGSGRRRRLRLNPVPPPLRPPGPKVQELKWTAEDFAAAGEGQLPLGKHTDEWVVGDIEAGFKEADLVLDETWVGNNTSHQPMETRTAMAYWQNGKLYMHCSTQSVDADRRVGRALGRHQARGRRHHLRVHGRRVRQQGLGVGVRRGRGALVEEGQRPGDDADLARRGAEHRPGAAGAALPRQGGLPEGRADHRHRRPGRRRQRSL